MENFQKLRYVKITLCTPQIHILAQPCTYSRCMVEYESVHVSPVASVAVPSEDIYYSVSGPWSSFSKMQGCPTPPPYRPPFHRPSPAAAPPFASKPQINGQQNSVPLTVPCGADPPRVIIKVKE